MGIMSIVMIGLKPLLCPLQEKENVFTAQAIHIVRATHITYNEIDLVTLLFMVNA